MSESADYVVDLTGTGPKKGDLSSSVDRLPVIEVASPPQFGGPEAVWTPEHMFVASVASCLMTTFHAIAATSGLDVAGYADSARGRLVRDENRLYRMESVTLRPRILIYDASHRDKALRLLEKAEQVCLISRSIAAEVELAASVEVVERAAVG